jgi:hypothetical protein
MKLSIPLHLPRARSGISRAAVTIVLGALIACGSAAEFGAPFAAGSSSGEQYDTPLSDAGRAADAASAPTGSSLCKRNAATCKDVGKGCAVASDAGAVSDAGKAPSPETCRLDVESKASCSANGMIAEGGACQNATDCGEGLECIRNGGQVEGQCRAYCCAGTCDATTSSSGNNGKTFCDIQFAKTAGFKVPVCMPVKACRLFEKGGCASGETCAVVNEEDGTTGCVEQGPAQVGQSCDEVHCGDGLTCLGRAGARRCFQRWGHVMPSARTLRLAGTDVQGSRHRNLRRLVNEVRKTVALSPDCSAGGWLGQADRPVGHPFQRQKSFDCSLTRLARCLLQRRGWRPTIHCSAFLRNGGHGDTERPHSPSPISSDQTGSNWSDSLVRLAPPTMPYSNCIDARSRIPCPSVS